MMCIGCMFVSLQSPVSFTGAIQCSFCWSGEVSEQHLGLSGEQRANLPRQFVMLLV